MKRILFAALIVCILLKLALAEAAIAPNFYGGEIRGADSVLQLGDIYFFSTPTSSSTTTSSTTSMTIPISTTTSSTTSTASTTTTIGKQATTTVLPRKENITTTTIQQEPASGPTSTTPLTTTITSTTTSTTLKPTASALPKTPTTTTTSTTTMTTTTTVRRTSGPVSVIGQPIHFPSPYSPTKNQLSGLTIQYELSNDADIDIYVFNIAGGMVKKISCYAGAAGGSYGLNQVKWDGIPDQGGRLGNGMYATTIVARKEGRLLAKFKINVFD